MSKTAAVFVPYSEDYKNKCFVSWYASGRPGSSRLLDIIPEDENSRKPKYTLLADWRRDMEWDARADNLDAKALLQIDDILIFEKSKMLKRQAEAGSSLLEKGLEYLETKGIDSSSSAITAIIKGAELERTSRGVSELIRKLSQMSDEDVKQEILRLSARADANVIDAEEMEKSE